MEFDWRDDCGVGFQYPITSEGRPLQELDCRYVSRGWDDYPFVVVFFPQGRKNALGEDVDAVEINRGEELYDALVKYAEEHHGAAVAEATNAADDILSRAGVAARAEARVDARREARHWGSS